MEELIKDLKTYGCNSAADFIKKNGEKINPNILSFRLLQGIPEKSRFSIDEKGNITSISYENDEGLETITRRTIEETKQGLIHMSADEVIVRRMNQSSGKLKALLNYVDDYYDLSGIQLGSHYANYVTSLDEKIVSQNGKSIESFVDFMVGVGHNNAPHERMKGFLYTDKDQLEKPLVEVNRDRTIENMSFCTVSGFITSGTVGGIVPFSRDLGTPCEIMGYQKCDYKFPTLMPYEDDANTLLTLTSDYLMMSKEQRETHKQELIAGELDYINGCYELENTEGKVKQVLDKKYTLLSKGANSEVLKKHN